MEVNFDPQDCDEVIEKPLKWNKEKLKDLWISLLNLEAVSKACEDVELQGILLLLETIFSIFRNLKNKHDTTASKYKLMKNELDTTKEQLHHVREDLKRCKNMSCERCLELEKELLTLKKKQENNENRIKSIVNILNMKSPSEDFDSSSQADPVVAKAFNLVSQMLLGDERKIRTKRERQDSSGSEHMRTPGKKKKKLNRDILNLKGTNLLLNEEIIVPETLPAVEEKNSCLRNECVPETLDCVEGIMHMNNMKHNNNNLDGIETTPKKQSTLIAEADSPILGNNNKKSACLSSHIIFSPQKDSSDECTLTYEPVKTPVASALETKSPSLLKPQITTSSIVEPEMSQESKAKKNVKVETNLTVIVNNTKETVKRTKADYWKLQSLHSSSVEGGNRKLKQTKLSLARYPKKNDLSTLKEFNGGIRQSRNEGNFFGDRINGDCDEDTSLQLAIQESLNGKENLEEIIAGNLSNDFTEDDEDFVFQSPEARVKKVHPRLKNLFN
ncbi:hypothetical protein L9F63_016097, partial [Diploptera punctata]